MDNLVSFGKIIFLIDLIPLILNLLKNFKLYSKFYII
jgi:hypothetical protein